MAAASNSKSVELDDIKEQFDALRADMKEMAELISTGATERAVDAKEQAVERATQLTAEAKDKASQLQADAERAVVTNPMTALAIAAGVGFLFGAATRR